jgi:hypothetical protein
MELRIIMEDLQPPSGLGMVDGQQAWTFVGWLELIQKVEQLKDERETRPPMDSGPVA